MQRHRTLAEIALLAVSAVWGLTFVLVQDAIAVLPSLAFLGYRFAAAGLLVALLCLRPLSALPARGYRGGLAMGVFLTLGFVLQTLGLAKTTVSNAGFITGLVVVLTPVFGALFFRERPRPATWVAAGVSAVGLYLLAGGAGQVQEGDLLVLGGSAAFALHLLVTARAARLYPTGPLVAIQLATCGLICLGFGALRRELEAPQGRQVWTALVVTSLFASAAAFFIQTYAQRHAAPARTALILASEPVFAGFFGYVLKGERLTSIAWLGAALILGAILWVELLRIAEERAAGGIEN